MYAFLKPALVATALAFTAPVFAQAKPLDVPAGEYVLDKTHGSITFQVMHMGLSKYTARFSNFDATINLNPADPTKSTVSVTIDPKSVRTDFPYPEKENFDAVIASKFLGADANPAITFKSTKLVATGADTGKLTGDFTMNGVTKPVTLDVKLNAAMMHPMRKTPALGFSATGSLKRSDFGSSFLQGPIGDEVTFDIEVEFAKK